MRVHLKNLGPINEANININKVTIVGGHNATGKSTLSKFLYSFLRSNSYNREKIAYKDIVNLIREESLSGKSPARVEKCARKRTARDG